MTILLRHYTHLVLFFIKLHQTQWYFGNTKTCTGLPTQTLFHFIMTQHVRARRTIIAELNTIWSGTKIHTVVHVVFILVPLINFKLRIHIRYI